MSKQGESGPPPSDLPPGQGWDETTLLAELAERQERLVFEMLDRAEHSGAVEQENVRLAEELAGSLDRIQEVHHRVGNHLQALTGLLSAEEVAADSESARRALRESIARLASIAAIHDLLARDPRSGKLCLRELIERLSQHLLAQAGASGRVRVCAQVEQAVAPGSAAGEVELGGKAMTALVLIVTELLSNAIEHGFPEDAQGEVEVRLAQAGRAVRLMVRDNGRGLPAGFDVARAGTLGLKLVGRLAERDLGGRLSVRNEGGACFEVEFAIPGRTDSGGSQEAAEAGRRGGEVGSGGGA